MEGNGRMEHILIVDDERKIRDIIGKYARFEGYTVTEAEDGYQAVRLCGQNTYDIVIMDVMMPGMDGFLACQEIRRCRQIPVIMLSARGEEYDRIRGLELGADDYVAKPFSPKELMLRIRAVLNRTKGYQEDEFYKKEGLLVNLKSHEVFVDGKKVEMTPKEYGLLFYLVRNRGVALTRERLMAEVWGYENCQDDRTLDTHIKLLRNNLGEYRKYLVTLRGVGYRFEV